MAGRQRAPLFLRMKPIGSGIGQVVERIDRRIDQAEADQAEQKGGGRKVCPRRQTERHRQHDENVLDPVLWAGPV